MNASFGDLLGDKSQKLVNLSIKSGTVFLNKFENIDHNKFFVVAGVCKDSIFVCSVFINSDIHPTIKKKQSLLDLQVPVKKEFNNFLTHTSFVCCSSPLYMTVEKISEWIMNKTCKIIGNIYSDDLNNIITTIKNSGLFTEEEIKLYFQD